jgi:hypothetical protein
MRRKFNIAALKEKLRKERPDLLSENYHLCRSFYATRSAAEFWGWNWPDNIACMRAGKYITYAQLKQEKLEKQKRQLEQKRCIEMRKVAVLVWVFYNSNWIFGGWWTCIYNREFEITVDFRGTDYLVEPVMKAFPLGFLPFYEMYYDWMPAFAKGGKRKAWAWINECNRIVKIEPLTK